MFINENKQLEGFRVNKVLNNQLYPFSMPENLKPRMALYRNNDQLFENMMSTTTAKRKINIRMVLSASQNNVELTIQDSDGHMATEKIYFISEAAHKPQDENMRLQLSKLGNTPYSADEIIISSDTGSRFIPSSILAELRRNTLKSSQVCTHHNMKNNRRLLSCRKLSVKI